MAELTQCSIPRRQRHRYNDNIDVGSDSMLVRARLHLVDLNRNSDCYTCVTHNIYIYIYTPVLAPETNGEIV